MLLFASSAVAGTHDAARCIAAGADTDAALGGAGERALVLGEGEMGFECAGAVFCFGLMIMGCKFVAQILDRIVDANCVDQLAGVHAILGIEENLELAEGFHQLRAVHLRKQRGA